MAKAKKENSENEVSLTPIDPSIPRPRLHKLVIKNFRAISNLPVEIELDEIVILVGPNNVGKSSILRAYEVVMKHGSKECQLQIDDFPNGVVDADNLPEIELQTIVYDKSSNAPAMRWLTQFSDNEYLIRERWVWTSPNAPPQRKGFDAEKNDWDVEVPWGAPNVANSRRPLPHRIEAFTSPDAQAKEIADLLINLLKGKLKIVKTEGDSQSKSDYEILIDNIANLQKNIVAAAKDEIEKIETEISILLAKVFPNHLVKFDAKAETDVEKTYSPFKASPDLLMGPNDGFMSKVSQQGSGARRTLLWTALKYLSDGQTSPTENSRPNVLLLDEPEICLHPSAIREARSVLYDLPKNKNWQVMLTTHSPIFIDLSKDNTTVIRVERNEKNSITGTTLYRPTRSRMIEDDRANLKALNACDPYVNEFFFGGKIIVVEGDTEYTSFSLIKDLFPEKYQNLQIIRARGKGIIITLLKILNQFSTSYGVLHDADNPTCAKGVNPAWSMNESILKGIKYASDPSQIRHIACIKNFEEAIFDEQAKSDKPYNALLKIKDNITMQNKVSLLLDSLIDNNISPPTGCVKYTSLEDLAKNL